jgi:hypothetical protein
MPCRRLAICHVCPMKTAGVDQLMPFSDPRLNSRSRQNPPFPFLSAVWQLSSNALGRFAALVLEVL